jgi:20S proteasome alpha/beta subunit
VTIAAGFCCNDGIVLCADSQETISGYMKQYDGKIETILIDRFVIAIAGAGFTDYIKTAVDTIAAPGLKFANPRQLELALRDRSLEFFDRHMARWSNFPESERPTVELLIGVTGRNKQQYPCLFHCSGTSFHRVHEKAIGAGILLANSLVSEHMHMPGKLFTLEELSSLAIYILSKVKKQVDTCGGFTDLVTLGRGGDVAFAVSKDIDQLEHALDVLEKEASEKLRASIMEKKLPNMFWINK